MAKLALGGENGRPERRVQDLGTEANTTASAASGKGPAVSTANAANNSSAAEGTTNITANISASTKELQVEVATLKAKLEKDEQQMAAAKTVSAPVVIVLPGKGGMEKAALAIKSAVAEAEVGLNASKEPHTTKAGLDPQAGSNRSTRVSNLLRAAAQKHTSSEVQQRAQKLFGVVAAGLPLSGLVTLDSAVKPNETVVPTAMVAAAKADAASPALGVWGRLRSYFSCLDLGLWSSAMPLPREDGSGGRHLLGSPRVMTSAPLTGPRAELKSANDVEVSLAQKVTRFRAGPFFLQLHEQRL